MARSAAAPRRARTLSEALKALDQAALQALLSKRPDLTYPLPLDLAELATRASTCTSIARAMDQLNVWLRQVTEALAALPDPSSTDDVAELVDVAAETVAAAVGQLRDRALLWGEDDQLHLVRGVREYFEPYPGGLAPPSGRPLTPEQITRALAECDESVAGLLERLLWSPTGALRNADRKVDPAGAKSPVEQLLARSLLRPLDSETVILPREVAQQLRQGRFSPAPVSPESPVLTGRLREVGQVDRAAAGAAFEMLHDVELVAHSLEATTHRLLRTGGLAARDLSALARLLSCDVARAAFVVECAAAAGLVAPGPGLCLLPTLDYDRWAELEAPQRWRLLAEGWLRGARHYSRSTEPGAHVLGPEADAAGAPVLRALVLQLVVQAGVGVQVEVERLSDSVAWHYPCAARSAAALSTLVQWAWQEATWLGLVSLGAGSTSGQALLLPDAPLPAALVDLFPTPVDRIIVQADLTAVAPGPLEHALATDLRMLADQESRGGGGVYRFSAATLRRGFEAGWSSAEMHDWLGRHSATGIPQPLAYLIDDMARQYGSIRVGSALSYLRVEDPTQVAALLAAPEAPALGLRAVADGVLLSTADAHELVSFLRAHGHSPAVEDEDGSTLSAPASQRADGARKDVSPRVPTPAEAAAAIVAVEQRRRRLGSEVAAHVPRPRSTTEQTLRQLQTATSAAAAVNVRYVAADGLPAERELNPLDLGAGMMRAVDRSSSQVLSIPLARISSVWPVTDAT